MKRIFSVFLTLLFTIDLFILPMVSAGEIKSNRFNIVFVSDASKSMLETDPNNYRDEAIKQFTSLLSDEGNYVGGVVFSTHVDKVVDLQLANNLEVKKIISEKIKEVAPHGFTNIGEGLNTAVDMISKAGDSKKPSVIIFLSDGNTAMATDDDLNQSLNHKAEAIQKAREKGIPIYSITLNANGEADTSEMKQISQATGGQFQEVKNAQDLQTVFNAFYNLIYGTSTVPLLNEKFPADGRLETVFQVPNIGVEEVNIVINGITSAIKLYRPDASEESVSPLVSETFTMLKVSNVIAGEWHLVTEGVPGEEIKINMVYNPNLDLEISTRPNESIINPEDNLTVMARLKDSHKVAVKNEDYQGYKAKLVVFDAYGKDLDNSDMLVKDGHFITDYKFKEGAYHYQVQVTGNGLEKKSEVFGPLTVSKKVKTEKEKRNTPPKAEQDRIEKTVWTLPFMGGKYDLDLNTLAKDKQDKKLRYEIVSSSFLENDDYVLTKDYKLKMYHFSLSKGSFDIKATDSGGLSTHVEVVVKTFNLGWFGLGLIGLGVLLFAYTSYSLSRKSFYGNIQITLEKPGELTKYKDSGRLGRGRYPLASFGLSNLGLHMTKSYFQATGQRKVILKLNKKLDSSNGSGDRFTIEHGHKFILYLTEDKQSKLSITFTSIKKR